MMFSVVLLEENNINYILASNFGKSEQNNTGIVKVYDTNGKFIKLINESNQIKIH